MEDGEEKRNFNVLAYDRECGATEESTGATSRDVNGSSISLCKKKLFDMLALQITDIYDKYYPEAKEE